MRKGYIVDLQREQQLFREGYLPVGNVIPGGTLSMIMRFLALKGIQSTTSGSTEIIRGRDGKARRKLKLFIKIK